MAISLDEAAESGPSAQGFQAKRSRASKDISYAGVRYLAGEYGEKRFLHPIGNGSGRTPWWGQDCSAAMDASDDSHGFAL